MQRIFDMVDSVADTKATVLITGESGTGKSLIARAIHRRSSRRDKPFVEVACGALPETLLESELFGHAAGAFTGAIGDKIGKFMQADGGTIFLDEIGTASPSMQVKLLRVLQELEFEQVGGVKTFRVDTRVILATNEDLSRAVAEGRFRQDLFYRVNVINIELPPLRDRFRTSRCWPSTFPRRSLRGIWKDDSRLLRKPWPCLQRHAWPGNVRELQNVVERAVLLGKVDVVSSMTCPAAFKSAHRRQRPIVRRMHAERGVGRTRATDHSGSARGQQLESKCHRRRAGHQSHDALQENETAWARSRRPQSAARPSLSRCHPASLARPSAVS